MLAVRGVKGPGGPADEVDRDVPPGAAPRRLGLGLVVEPLPEPLGPAEVAPVGDAVAVDGEKAETKVAPS